MFNLQLEPKNHMTQLALQEQTRRHFLARSGLGLGAIALASLAGRGFSATSASLPQRVAVSPAKAKSVIYLHMAGSPSQLELFDYKPELTKFDGEACPEEYLAGKRFAFIKGVPKMMGPLYRFRQHGDSGQWMSELLPQLSQVADELAVIRSVTTDQFNHAPAQLLVNTGQPRLGYPSLGAWVTYGLGSACENLPGFVVLLSGGKTPDGGKSLWGTGFLPTVYQGVQCRTTGDPVLYLSSPPGVSRDLCRETHDAIRDLNVLRHETSLDPEILTRISQYELAFNMQASVPQVMDISQEPKHILDLYGAKPGYVSQAETKDDPRTFYKSDDPTFANNCLLARRLVEAGVRFVQLYDWGWDHHGTQPGESLDETLPIKCQQIDRAIAGLVIDLRQRGLLDETLIIWGGEFGRTPMAQNNIRDTPIKGFYGRDHHPHAYTMFLCGGGVKPGLTYGSTDEIGYYAGDKKVTQHDLHATLLSLLGVDPFTFSYSYQGLNQRLIGPSDEGRILSELIA